MSNQAVSKQVATKEVQIYKYKNISQFVLKSRTLEASFLLEDDAQRFARELTGSSQIFDVVMI